MNIVPRIVILGAFAKLRKGLLASSCPSVCPRARTHTHTTCNTAFPRRQWFYERASVLLYSLLYKYLENRKGLQGSLWNVSFLSTSYAWIIRRCDKYLARGVHRTHAKPTSCGDQIEEDGNDCTCNRHGRIEKLAKFGWRVSRGQLREQGVG
jgi:hypothetical protein